MFFLDLFLHPLLLEVAEVGPKGTDSIAMDAGVFFILDREMHIVVVFQWDLRVDEVDLSAAPTIAIITRCSKIEPHLETFIAFYWARSGIAAVMIIESFEPDRLALQHGSHFKLVISLSIFSTFTQVNGYLHWIFFIRTLVVIVVANWRE